MIRSTCWADVGGRYLVLCRRGVPRVGDGRNLFDECLEASLGDLSERRLSFRPLETTYGDDRERDGEDHQDREQVVRDDGGEPFETIVDAWEHIEGHTNGEGAERQRRDPDQSRLAPAGLVRRSDESLDGFFTVPVVLSTGWEAP